MSFPTTDELPNVPDLLAPLTWMESVESVETIDVGMPSALRKLLPAMHFREISS